MAYFGGDLVKQKKFTHIPDTQQSLLLNLDLCTVRTGVSVVRMQRVEEKKHRKQGRNGCVVLAGVTAVGRAFLEGLSRCVPVTAVSNTCRSVGERRAPAAATQRPG